METITYPALKFGRSCSPSAMPKIIKRIKAYKIAMSCGGGMGGSFWEEYIIDDEGVFPSNTIITRTNILGEEVIINTSFMVKAEPIDVLIIEHDTTEFTNYHSKNCNESHSIYYVSVHPNQECEITDRYDDWKSVCERKKLIECLSYVDGVRIR